MPLLLLSLSACSPVIPIPPGSAVSDLVLSHTSPESSVQRLTLDGRSYPAPTFSFSIPAGPHTVSIAWEVTISDRCNPEENMCSSTRLSGTCSGQFLAEPNERYRILLDSRRGTIAASVQKRGGSALYIGQDEAIVAPLMCQKLSQRDQYGTPGIVTF
ncbi:MAG: hypothetical protein RL518_1217 [Pseudomonadota bacterium]